MNEDRIKRISDDFHALYYENNERTWSDTRWFGTETLKCPLDMWIYQEILNELKPLVIVETGTAEGGSALFLAHLCDLLGRGRIITIDIEERVGRPIHDRITYVTASSIAPETIDRVKEFIGGDGPVLVILDSDHSYEHVLKEMRLYAPLVTEKSYLIVEDSNINGYPVLEGFGPGPMEAILEYLKEPGEFRIDMSKEKYFLTFNPRGYLKKLGKAESHGDPKKIRDSILKAARGPSVEAQAAELESELEVVSQQRDHYKKEVEAYRAELDRYRKSFIVRAARSVAKVFRSGS